MKMKRELITIQIMERMTDADGKHFLAPLFRADATKVGRFGVHKGSAGWRATLIANGMMCLTAKTRLIAIKLAEKMDQIDAPWDEVATTPLVTTDHFPEAAIDQIMAIRAEGKASFIRQPQGAKSE